MIVALPRSGTQVIQDWLSLQHRIPNLLEPFNDPSLGFDTKNFNHTTDPYKWTNSFAKGVFKLLAHNLYYVDIEKMLALGGVDHTVIIDRNNLTDCCVSLYYAKLTQVYHYLPGQETVKINSFDCPNDWVRSWIKHYHRFRAARNVVLSSSAPHSLINYDDFMADKLQHIAGQPLERSVIKRLVPTVSANLQYDKLCTNYQAVHDQISELSQTPMELPTRYYEI